MKMLIFLLLPRKNEKKNASRYLLKKKEFVKIYEEYQKSGFQVFFGLFTKCHQKQKNLDIF
ncbi:hypothetical protein CO229_00020 [Mycoplasmopsis bovirhinis]|nr:hypothetical protein CO229_00020 [Mycoplasmopsis bovirhinis]